MNKQSSIMPFERFYLKIIIQMIDNIRAINAVIKFILLNNMHLDEQLFYKHYLIFIRIKSLVIVILFDVPSYEHR